MRGVVSATDLRGFLYYHLPRGAPPLAGEIRFRVTGSPDPTLFLSSPDLLNQDGLPWRIPLLNLIRRRSRPDPLWLILLEDGLVSHNQSLLSSQMNIPEEPGLSMNTRLIYAFGQPLLLDFSKRQSRFRVVGHDRLEAFRMHISPNIPPRHLGILSWFSSESSPSWF